MKDGPPINILAGHGVDKTSRDSFYCDAMQAHLFSQTSVVAMVGGEVKGGVLGFIPQDLDNQDVYVPWKIVTSKDLSEADALKLCADMLSHVFSRNNRRISQVEIPDHIFALGHNGAPYNMETLDYLSQNTQPEVRDVKYLEFSDHVKGVANKLHGLVSDISLDLNSPNTYRMLMHYFGNSCYLYNGDKSPLSAAVVGFKIPGENLGFLWQVGVHTNFQGKGIGPEIINSWTRQMIDKYEIKGYDTTVVPSKKSTSTQAFKKAVNMLKGATLETIMPGFFESNVLGGAEEEDLLRISL